MLGNHTIVIRTPEKCIVTVISVRYTIREVLQIHIQPSIFEIVHDQKYHSQKLDTTRGSESLTRLASF
jgi:hypothetical protein